MKRLVKKRDAMAPEQRKTVTLKMVAARAGCSVSSVSTVLNNAKGNSMVSDVTRKRIFAIAKELGYHPNFASRSLRTRSTRTIGVYVQPDYKSHTVTVIETIANSAAEKAGILSGDLIVKVDGVAATDTDLNVFMDLLRGEIGSAVSITVLRDGKEITYEMERVQVETESVGYELYDDGIAYVVISSFNANTDEQFISIINELEKTKKVKGYIFNVRYCCPRMCGVDRSVETGVCGVGETPRVAKVYLHQWEEPCISVKNGSGTIFFSGCNLKCVYCQNYKISSEAYGKDITVQQLAKLYKKLELMGADNINLVTPTHYVDAIIEALKIYRPNIPIVYNSSGYENMESLEKLKEWVDVYLVDFKYYDSELARVLSSAPNYPEVAKSVITKMREFQPNNIYEGEKLVKGVIIRHLILPNHTEDSINILKWIKDNINEPCISLMGQYTPMYKANEYSDISRKLKPIEYKRVSNMMLKLGLTDGYMQELSSADESYTPTWDLEGIDF